MEQSSWEASSISYSQEVPVCFGTWGAVTIFKRACNLSLSWSILIESVPSYIISLTPILILFSHLHLDLPNRLFLSHFPVCISLIRRMSHMPNPSLHLLFDHSNNTWWGVKNAEAHHAVLSSVILCWSLSLWHCMSSGCRWRGRPQDVEGGFDCIE
jgi:hypothetical protein